MRESFVVTTALETYRGTAFNLPESSIIRSGVYASSTAWLPHCQVVPFHQNSISCPPCQNLHHFQWCCQTDREKFSITKQINAQCCSIIPYNTAGHAKTVVWESIIVLNRNRWWSAPVPPIFPVMNVFTVPMALIKLPYLGSSILS